MLWVEREDFDRFASMLLVAAHKCRDDNGMMVHTRGGYEEAERVALGALVALVGHPVAIQGTVFMPSFPNLRKADADSE